MISSHDLRELFKAERPFIEQQLELAKHFADVRKAQADKGLDWGRAKMLFKAMIEDEEDGGDRVSKIIERADTFSEYATLMNNKSFSSSQANADAEAMLTKGHDGPSKVESASRLAGGRTSARGRARTTPAPLAEPVAANAPHALGDGEAAPPPHGPSDGAASTLSDAVRDAEPTTAPQHNETRAPLVVGADGRTGSATLPTAANLLIPDDLSIPEFLRRPLPSECPADAA